jgi:hypothetical protein
VVERYEIWLGPNRIAVRDAGSALLALLEYLHGEGVGDAEGCCLPSGRSDR